MGNELRRKAGVERVNAAPTRPPGPRHRAKFPAVNSMTRRTRLPPSRAAHQVRSSSTDAASTRPSGPPGSRRCASTWPTTSRSLRQRSPLGVCLTRRGRCNALQSAPQARRTRPCHRRIAWAGRRPPDGRLRSRTAPAARATDAATQREPRLFRPCLVRGPGTPAWTWMVAGPRPGVDSTGWPPIRPRCCGRSSPPPGLPPTGAQMGHGCVVRWPRSTPTRWVGVA